VISPNWKRPKDCGGGECVEIAHLPNERIAIRSSKRPHNIAILDAYEFDQLRTATFEVEEKP
jgi:hypothetical protein